MKIKIEGYRNIQSLDYEIVDQKLNLLFGVSGSGKSSIAMAMISEDMEFNKKVDYTGEPKVLVNGKVSDAYNTIIFNSNSVSKYLTAEDDGVFNILIDDESSLSKEQEKFDRYMLRFKSVIDSYNSQFISMKELTKDLVGTLTKKDELKSTSKIKQLENNFNKNNNSRIIKEINLIEDTKLDWIIEGKSYIENEKCPFCLKKLSSKRFKKIVRYSEFDTKNLKIVKDKSSQFSSLGFIKPVYTTSGISKLSYEMKKIAIAVNEFEKIKTYVENIGVSIDLTLSEIVVKDELYEYFPNLRRIIFGLNKNITNINQKTEVLNKKTKDILSRNLKIINDKIEVLGIPYQIEAQYKKGKIKSYKLKLNNDSSSKDRKQSLSNGEKNLISFLIFALDVKKNGISKLCIIDDPVSSYDEHRRKLIYDFINEILKGFTVLVLSHDSVFARVAANDKNNSNIGSIDYFENNNGNVELISITDNDFNKFDHFLKERIIETNDYYQKIINLRMYYEGSRKLVYGYLSQILHFDSFSKIESWLVKKGKTEDDLISAIKIDTQIDLPKIEADYKSKIDITKYSLIEKAALVREFIPKKTSSFRNELNHIMHVNDRHNICLDPYKFSFCSSSTRLEISKIISDLL